MLKKRRPNYYEKVIKPKLEMEKLKQNPVYRESQESNFQPSKTYRQAVIENQMRINRSRFMGSNTNLRFVTYHSGNTLNYRGNISPRGSVSPVGSAGSSAYSPSLASSPSYSSSAYCAGCFNELKHTENNYCENCRSIKFGTDL